jgi:Alginate export
MSLLLLGLAGPAAAQPGVPPPATSPVTFSLDGSAQLTHERQSFWGLGQQFAPTADYPRSHTWLEVFVKPGLKLQAPLGHGLSGYGGVSLLASGTVGEDVFQVGKTGRLLVEDAYVGLRGQVDGWNWDVSAGAQPFKLGHGFLLSSGAGNGFERGGAILAPRRAWGMTGIGRVSNGRFSAEAFHLNPNELESGDTGTRLWGLHGRWGTAEDGSIGLAHIRVSASGAPYPQAPVNIVENGRDGLQTTDLIWHYEPRSGALAGLSLLGEAARQRNARIGMKAQGWGFELGYRLAQLPFSPKLSWSMRGFSGDDPATPGRLERFDPLFYDGAPQTWSSGGNGSFAFYNSNLVVHRLRAELVLSQRDFVNLNWWKVNAAKANSPVQYGQAARLAIVDGSIGIVAGFPTRALSQEVYAEYTRVLTGNLFMTTGVAGAFPGRGVKAVVPDARDWWGVFTNVTFKY